MNCFPGTYGSLLPDIRFMSLVSMDREVGYKDKQDKQDASDGEAVEYTALYLRVHRSE